MTALAQNRPADDSLLGTPVVRTFSPQAYDGNGQVWDIAQDGRGLLYIASSYGLQQYDGARWRYLPTKNETTPWAVARGTAGTLYVGARNELGTYRPDSSGRLAYRSLLDRVPAARRPVGNVRDAVATEEAVFFRAESGVLRWPGPDAADSMQVVADSSATALTSCRNTAYVHLDGDRPYRVDGTRLAPVNGTSRLADAVVVALLQTADGTGCEVVTEEQGRIRIAPSGLEPLAWPGGPFEEPVQNAVRGPDGALAVSTASTLRLVDPLGQIQSLSQGEHLPDGTLQALHLSDRQALWVATNSGVARVAWPDPVAVVREPPALRTIVTAITRHEGRLLAATRDGVWRIEPNPGRQLAATGETYDLLSTEAGLLVASSNGLAVLRNGQARFLTERTAYALHQSRRDAAVVYVSRYDNGLLRLRRRKGRWRVVDRSDRVEAPIYTMAEDPDGRLWLGTGYSGILRLERPETDLQTTPLARFDTTDGLPAANFNYSVQLGDSVRAVTAEGLYRFADSSFVPDDAFAPVYTDDIYRHWPVVSGPDGAVWMDFGGHKFGVATGGADGPVHWTARPFRRFADLGDVRTIYPDAAHDSLVWIAAENSLVRYDRRLERFGGHAQPFETLIRGVRTRGDSLLYGGDTGTTRLPADVGFEHANLRFEFGATSYEQIDGPTHNWDRPRQYRWQLVGLDEDWTDWTTEAQADYTRLPPGTYTLRVQARNLYREVGTTAQLSLTVLPPWYRTWWAYALYLLAAAGLVAGAVRWRTWQLRGRQEELEQTVAERTGEVREQRDRLEEQAEKLRALDEAKSRFFANVSHEFRTPLTLIRGPVDEVREQLARGRLEAAPMETDAAADQLDVARRNVERLQRLIGQILGLARMDAGTYDLAARPTPLGPAAERIADRFSPLADRQGLALHVDTEPAPEDAAPTYVDPEALEHVVGNLLSNAIKFTPEGGTVEVTVAEHPDAATVAVADTGPGIPEGEQERLFERFAQAEASSGDREGAGIGLAFAHDLVDLHGGTLEVDSVEGEGTTFTVHVPRGTDALADDQLADDAPNAQPSTPPSERAPAFDPGSTPAEQSQNAPNDQSKIVLIVDDNADVRRYVRSILEPEYAVLEAADGEDGLRTAREALPDVILADVMMPGLDGREMTRVLKDDPDTEAIPIIMVTARAETSDEIEGLRVGADDYVTKPFDADVLRQRVGGVLTLQERLRRRLEATLREERRDESEEDVPDRGPVEQQTRQEVREHLTDPAFGVDDLAGAMATSRSTLYRKLKAEADLTPSALITDVRLAEAQSLLDEGEAVTQVAYAVGYASLASFTQAFQERVGAPPTTYAAERG